MYNLNGMVKTRSFISSTPDVADVDQARMGRSGSAYPGNAAKTDKGVISIRRVLLICSFVFLLVSTFPAISLGQIVAAPQGFWDNVNISFGAGIHNFHGDFDGPRIQNVPSEAPLGVPVPGDGNIAFFRFEKPIPWPRSSQYKLKGNLGVEYIYYQSPAAEKLMSRSGNGAIVQPINIINRAFGLSTGLTLEYLLNDKLSVEPYMIGRFLAHSPQTDGFYSLSGSGEPRIMNPNSVNPPLDYVLRNERRTRTANEGIPPLMIAQIALGFRVSSTFIGSYRYFIDYGLGFFLSDYFDNTSDLNPTATAKQNDRLTTLSAGVIYPLNVDRRQLQTSEKKQVRIDRKKIAKIERIQNIANLITTDEDLLELQKILSDKILLYDTPGVRFNELAAKCIERKIPLGDSQVMTDMIEVPGGSYIIGLTAVDELEVQVQGRKRITINPFLIDKYEVTNEQYRTFLIAMKALPAPLPVNPADTLIAKFNYGSTIEWQELIRRAQLQDYMNHARPPQLNGPGDLMPADSMWTKYGLNEVIPWDTYFYDPYYDNYPVVCVNWYQARLFAAWSGKRLPTESEWEYVARSGVSGRVYPWDGLEVQTKTGKFRANFKQSRGVYDQDGYAIMAPVDAYLPNDFGLYNTSGNVSEWVLDAWNPSYVVLQNVGTSNFVSPYYANDQEPRKIHRGGSWQSTQFYIGLGVRNFQDKNQGTPFVGFRCAKSLTRTYR
jgi:formylglycine-generating enzyme required for sulfatase activity